MAVREILAGVQSLTLDGDCLATLEIPAEPGRFTVVVNDDHPCSTTVDWYGVMTRRGTVLCREPMLEQHFDRWTEVDDRFDAAVEPHESNRFGLVSDVYVFPHDAAEAMGAAKVDIR